MNKFQCFVGTLQHFEDGITKGAECQLQQSAYRWSVEWYAIRTYKTRGTGYAWLSSGRVTFRVCSVCLVDHAIEITHRKLYRMYVCMCFDFQIFGIVLTHKWEVSESIRNVNTGYHNVMQSECLSVLNGNCFQEPSHINLCYILLGINLNLANSMFSPLSRKWLHHFQRSMECV